MVTIRLSRVGRNKQASFRIIVSEKKRDVFGRSIEIVGHYHPRAKEKKDELILNTERIQYWLGKGATTSNTLHNLFINAGIIKGEKKRTVYGKAKKPLDSARDNQEAATAAPSESALEKTTEAKEETQTPKENTPTLETTATAAEAPAG